MISESRFGQTLLFPKDPEKGGTWLAISDHGRIVCLLNGAFEPFIKKDAYRKSRGAVVLDYFSFANADEFRSKYDFTDIAPFTLILLEVNKRYELIWDGHQVYFSDFAHTPRIWSSVTLYPEKVRAWRRKLFTQWRAGSSFSQDSIMHFHQHAGDEDAENGFLMNRDEIVKTLSVSSILKKGEIWYFKHKDMVNDQLHYKRIKQVYHQTMAR
jgi:hypothetical protein